MTLVKICGITRLDDALAAIESGADLLGFNFYRKSPRYIAPGLARRICGDLPPSIPKVGVFVNESDAVVRDLAVTLELSYLQFHGTEVPAYCEQFATPYWKAFPLRDEKTLEIMSRYRPDYYLVDAHVENLHGGTGVTCNWDLAREAKKLGKIFLAGGLTPENVEAAMQVVRPDGVDVASGVESAPGRKDAAKMEEFIAKVRGLEA